MGGRRIAALALSGALVAGGTGAAIAAVSKDERKQAEDAILEDAAKRLNVTPDKLRDALSAAQDAQLDQAVEDGKLTKEQADAIKARRKQSGTVLGGPRMHPHGPRLRFRGGHGPGRGAMGTMAGDLASALGLSREKLAEQLRDGKSIADVAKAQGKSLASVRSALKAKARTRLDKAVEDGDITRKQADAMLEHLDERLENLGSERGLRPRMHRRHGGGMPPMPEVRPGGLDIPGGGAPELAPAPGFY